MSAEPNFKIVAIDGGAATGKSSTAKGVAAALDMMHVDTGAHYRTVTHALLADGADLAEPLADQAESPSFELGTELEGRSARLSVGGFVPPDAAIRSPEVNAAVSKVAAAPAVRKLLFEYQRSQAAVAKENGFQGLVMEGRDIGSIIFPDADFAFFLFADEATREERRANEGQTDSIAERDRHDRNRKAAPLVCPDNAISIDTGALDLEGVIGKISHIVRGKIDA